MKSNCIFYNNKKYFPNIIRIRASGESFLQVSLRDGGDRHAPEGHGRTCAGDRADDGDVSEGVRERGYPLVFKWLVSPLKPGPHTSAQIFTGMSEWDPEPTGSTISYPFNPHSTPMPLPYFRIYLARSLFIFGI